MSKHSDYTFHFNRKIKFDFDGGKLSTDAGLALLWEFICELRFTEIVEGSFRTNGASFHLHSDYDIFWQEILLNQAGYSADNSSDNLRKDPALKEIFNKPALASQPTISRFFNRMDESTLEQLRGLIRKFRNVIYQLRKPSQILLDIDSTQLETYGKQEGSGFNGHYKTNGYPPLVCFDGNTGDLLGIKLREGNKYTSNGVTEFLQPIIYELHEDHPDISLSLRADSGFATPELYDQCESNQISYAIRLKENSVLDQNVIEVENRLHEIIREGKVSYAVEYGEFQYQAHSWDRARRVVYKVEKTKENIFCSDIFIVTNMDSEPKQVVEFYCKRGMMENYIKECKNSFNFKGMCSHSQAVNENRLMLDAIAYNIFNWFKRLVLPGKMKNQMAETIRVNLLKIAVRVTKSARSIQFKLCSCFKYQKEFYSTLKNIHRLRTSPIS